MCGMTRALVFNPDTYPEANGEWKGKMPWSDSWLFLQVSSSYTHCFGSRSTFYWKWMDIEDDIPFHPLVVTSLWSHKMRPGKLGAMQWTPLGNSHPVMMKWSPTNIHWSLWFQLRFNILGWYHLVPSCTILEALCWLIWRQLCQKSAALGRAFEDSYTSGLKPINVISSGRIVRLNTMFKWWYSHEHLHLGDFLGFEGEITVYPMDYPHNSMEHLVKSPDIVQ